MFRTRTDSRRPPSHLLPAMAVVLLAGCASVGIDVRTEEAPGAKFAALHTYDWIPGLQEAMGGLGMDEKGIDRLIKRNVDDAMKSRGYQRLDGSEPDFLLRYRVAVKSKAAVASIVGDRKRYGRARRFEYEEGELVIEVLQPGSLDVIWRGAAQAEINRYAPGDFREERMARVTAQIVKQLPKN